MVTSQPYLDYFRSLIIIQKENKYLIINVPCKPLTVPVVDGISGQDNLHDSLPDSLCLSGRGCFGGNQFCGTLCYADDLTILAPSPDALRKMLAQCDAYAVSHDIHFNVSKNPVDLFSPFTLFRSVPIFILRSSFASIWIRSSSWEQASYPRK